MNEQDPADDCHIKEAVRRLRMWEAVHGREQKPKFLADIDLVLIAAWRHAEALSVNGVTAAEDPADDRHDAVTRLMAENDKLKTEIARLENECRGWNAETKAGFFRQADYIRKYQEENDRLQEQAELRRLSLLLEEQAAYNRMCHDEELRDVLDD